jgi:serine/threonine-protein kinase HipA
MNPVEKLCFIGFRGMGALEFEPAQLKAGGICFLFNGKRMWY